MTRKTLIVCAVAICFLASLALAQRPGGGGRHRKPTMDLPQVSENGIPKTDPNLSGRFTFVRVRFDTSQFAQYYGYNNVLGDGGPPWSHDYPVAGRHLMKIMSELSKIDATQDINEPILSFDDPMLFKFPFAYLCEVGFMNLNDAEIAGMREYLKRGGFLLVDDFRRPNEFANFQYNVKRAFPELELKKLDASHPIFNCFFSIKADEVKPVYGGGYVSNVTLNPEFWGLEDETGRLMMIVNYNYDVSDYWQFSDNAFRPIEETNEAYKFGVNYIIYALTH
ncbi:MAG TPA: DUF4159 domain-containing protein [Blastocatellia bacterium]|nr:DUF4159 domain-containing protein [Blastocatellia bacterium]HMV85542.1 DUF4159 domain-containing protein [Blastocatellia bacterium]HMY76361.1 DUF4159 domain-containing protein [Blastocatellia bacterium]HMZ17856.1 DUF4159 domain-containing protein [Blastocatellia bacterium]HNG32380.1 DUF4159 domain-containing protein [Blastocatellia bacterium]